MTSQEEGMINISAKIRPEQLQQIRESKINLSLLIREQIDAFFENRKEGKEKLEKKKKELEQEQTIIQGKIRIIETAIKKIKDQEEEEEHRKNVEEHLRWRAI